MGKIVIWEYASPIGLIVIGCILDFFTLSGAFEMRNAYFLFALFGVASVGFMLFGIDGHMNNRSLRLTGSKVLVELGTKKAKQIKPEGDIIYAGRGCA